MAMLDPLAHLGDVEGQLGDEDDVGARRRARSAARSSRRGGPSPRRPSPGRGTRPWCAAGRSRPSAICTAVSNPNVTSVADRSLSIVLGTPDDAGALAGELGRDAERVLAADRDQRVDVLPAQRVEDARDPVVRLERVRPARPEDRAASRQDAPRSVERRPSRTRSRPASRAGTRRGCARRPPRPCARWPGSPR